ncbi:exodeoxyribonuclease V subunit beta [Thiorhodovibrio frisius]|uniref:RecBCD enzyme subunit RecB n=1 Tax=Thiorhodovibrio frisius TaxID=631362 RepID=H8Z7P8_9GAMM|nr:exodeoxyribonuclease V subunit beta [Thiorhodovibrio frisius]EIC19901.1 exodeoxyribonuclease V, beta subunit [Thiorhodovibrio frisius]WPL20629.1 Exodeoxyribonuclease V beta chain [Thiorhodovibrio frisius]
MGGSASDSVVGLDPLRFPLHGQRLIEASAGTGKTFTLALLYTRLVLGHGLDGCAFDRPLVPPEILVVTFTDAATKELRARIRERLVEAADWFAAPADATPADALLGQMRADYPPDAWPGCARRLRQAADWMDEAMIVTIHSFCQRMLKEHAFATRGLFQRELVTDQSDLLLDALRDYWRMHFYPLPAEQIACIQAVVDSPEALYQKLGDWIKRPDAQLSHSGQPVLPEDLRAPLAATCDQRQREAAAAELEEPARARWREHRKEVDALLYEIRDHLDGRSYPKKTVESFGTCLAELAQWADGGKTPDKIQRFAQEGFKFRGSAPVQQAPAHPAFQAIADWQAEVARVQAQSVAPDPPLAPRLLAHAADWLSRELPRRLGQRAEMGFDDLLRDLDAALNPSTASLSDQTLAETLAATLRAQFPVALIDEFQDTDPLQYRIFERIYAQKTDAVQGDAPHKDAQSTALVMIGDPKQAIYGFRGADIHAYLAARQATRDQLYTLKTNYRSTQAVVDACNRLFEHAEQHDAGAFRFGSKEAPDDNPIPYVRVKAAGRADQLLLDQQPAPAMTFWWLDGENGGPLGSPAYREAMAEVAASEIVRWLQQAREDRAGFRTGNHWQPLRPRDIAILVRNRKEAAAMRDALAKRRVNSVYLSDRDSVFATAEAADVLHWLRACAQPRDEGLVRTALGTNTLALALDAFDHWQRDELAWEAQLERFRDYRQLWQHRGVLAALRRLMHDHDLPARLLAQPGGERSLTNLLHLSEWLQQAASNLDGEQALIRHLSEHLGEGDSSDESILRLESDAELVRVITIHKSKGLEYPLVLLPFICSWRPVDGNARSVIYRPDASMESLERFIEVAGNKVFPDAWEQADDARLSEDMRLLYVAATRARHALWLGIAPLKNDSSKQPKLHRSAIGYALNGAQAFPTSAAVHQRLAQLTQGCDAIALLSAPEPDARCLTAEDDETLDPAREPAHRPFAPWWISSYSALRLGMSAPPEDQEPAPGAETANQETALEEAALDLTQTLVPRAEPVGGAAAQAQPPVAATASPAAGALHDFPRGSRAGTFLHGLLEWAGRAESSNSQSGLGRGFAAAAASPPERREMLARRCTLRGLQGWTDPLNAWLGAMLSRSWILPQDAGRPDSAPEPPGGKTGSELVLAELSPSDVQVEMEFWIQTRSVDIRRLDALVQQHCLAGESRPTLHAGQLNGMLKGFIDLVFEHQGRFYVLDWKSNWLGPDNSAYTPEAMRGAILHHRYDLQYLLYLLALHRLLGARLPDYDYDRHIGGAVYVFLRGAGAPSQGLFTDRPPRALIEALDGLFAGRSAQSQEEDGE